MSPVAFFNVKNGCKCLILRSRSRINSWNSQNWWKKLVTVNKVEFCGMLMSFVYHRFHADRELSLLAGHAHPVGIDTANFTPLAMSVSRRGCLQAGCNDCEFIGNEREQSVRLIGNESERRNAIFASSPDYACKLLHPNP